MKIEEIRASLEAKKLEIRGLLDNKDVAKAEIAMAEKRALDSELAIEIELEAEDLRSLQTQKIEKNKNEGSVVKMETVNEMRAMVKTVLGKEMNEEERAMVKSSDNLAVLPKQFINELEKIEKGFGSLEEYVTVIPVTKNEGTKPIFEADDSVLEDVAEGDTIGETGLKTSDMSFKCSKVGTITTLTSELVEDAQVEIEGLAKEQFTLKNVTTKNVRITNVIKASAVDVVGATSYKDINMSIDKAVPAVRNGLVIFTNPLGYAYLKNLEDKQGKNLGLVTEMGGKYYFNGKELVSTDEAFLPNATGKVTFYVCNSKEMIKMFKRNEVTVAKSALGGAGFEEDAQKLRILNRFDVKAGKIRNCHKIELSL